MSRTNLIFSTGIFVGVLALIVLLFIPSFNEYNRNQKINKEIEKLSKQAEQLKENNAHLSEKIEYFKTEAYKERIAKERLNMQKQDEQIVSVKQSVSAIIDDVENNNDNKEDLKMKTENKEANYKKWFSYFFGNL
ncbi:MAG: Cell division protein FtsL [Candidatus Moranbacteria bacterium GW2011_GWE2_35_2-]|nr:MAG: Cell division protein FtsL [Candidatus Moranbacteria bacterium GW2011_GWE2_35_2-]KKQ06624.1 MAG: Cell division protein FtsL [Candidatus Moranbacteria bacterium GW2011_GWF1_36_4]KKQ22786.1 MAG: Cell division protein FtsL [Candidatus Moranbacteria bacterium GW2011_GWF2_37_11]KKQ28797.1 MAG: Cell division protein FtsL [Candidatus Moranbacteria bacterium GW2011_GWD1_37_17]KKQ30983.1 MAG: Cell division protein FtsL [Candidatus Moranbacteria bacterium GW2011_GWE1_37_24]KKQ47035.1 MAG: Cell d